MDIAVFVCGLGAVIMDLGACCCGVFGILLAVAGLALGIFAWVAGAKQRRLRREEGRAPHGLLTAGWILGIVGTILAVLAAFAAVVCLIWLGAMMSLGTLTGRPGL